GGLRVTMLKDEIGIFHACLAQAFLGLLVFMGVATSRAWDEIRNRARSANVWLPVATTLIIYAQLALGATMRHQHRDLAILDFPAAYGQVVPDVSEQSLAAINLWRDKQALSDVSAGQIWLQMAHRFLALLIFCGVVGSWFALRRSLCVAWAVCVLCQITLGAWVIWSNKAADIATAHVAVGATMLALGVAICAFALRMRLPNESTRVAAKPIEEAHAL
ncbi:MAG: COX15/CtaA family protein, partial [Chthoniobacterales bacterium]